MKLIHETIKGCFSCPFYDYDEMGGLEEYCGKAGQSFAEDELKKAREQDDPETFISILCPLPDVEVIGTFFIKH